MRVAKTMIAFGNVATETSAKAAKPLDSLVLAVLSLLVVTLGFTKAAAIPLWSDELATLHLAEASSWRQMLTWSHTVDLNPPLEPSLARISIALLGPHEFGVRAPSVLAFAVAVCAIYIFLRRRIAVPYAVFGALLCLCSPEISYYLTEARPYALLLAGGSIAVLAYDSILSTRHATFNKILLATSLTCMLQAHLFGFFAAMAFVLAEAVRTARIRRIDFTTWLAIGLPLLSCVTYIPILHSQGASHSAPLIYEEKDRTSFGKALGFYHSFLYLPLAPLTKIIAVVLICLPYFPSQSPKRTLRFDPEFWTLFLSLLATPVLVATAFWLKAPGSGFFPRYSIVAVIPTVVLLASLTAWRAGEAYYSGWLLALASLGMVALTFKGLPRFAASDVQNGLLAAPASATKTEGLEDFCTDLPLVINNALDFLEDDYRVGQKLESRMIYVTDREQSLALEHETALESVADMGAAFHIRHHVVPSVVFLMQHQQFLVLSRNRHPDWFLDSMGVRHAKVIDLRTVHFAGHENRLWFVSRNPLTPTPSCVLPMLLSHP